MGRTGRNGCRLRVAAAGAGADGTTGLAAAEVAADAGTAGELSSGGLETVAGVAVPELEGDDIGSTGRSGVLAARRPLAAGGLSWVGAGAVVVVGDATDGSTGGGAASVGFFDEAAGVTTSGGGAGGAPGVIPAMTGRSGARRLPALAAMVAAAPPATLAQADVATRPVHGRHREPYSMLRLLRGTARLRSCRSAYSVPAATQAPLPAATAPCAVRFRTNRRCPRHGCLQALRHHPPMARVALPSVRSARVLCRGSRVCASVCVCVGECVHCRVSCLLRCPPSQEREREERKRKK